MSLNNEREDMLHRLVCWDISTTFWEMFSRYLYIRPLLSG